MPSLELRTAQQTSANVSDECVLLIAAEVDEAARLLDQLASPPGQPFHVEWVTRPSSGIERLRSGEITWICTTSPATHPDGSPEVAENAPAAAVVFTFSVIRPHCSLTVSGPENVGAVVPVRAIPASIRSRMW